MDKDTTTMRLHEFLRGDLTAMEMLLDELEDQARKLRALFSTVRLIADDLQTLEEGTVETIREDGTFPPAPRS